LKFSAGTLEISVGLLLTTRVTAKVCGELPALAEVMVTFSVYVPGPRPAKTAASSVRAKDCGVVPEVGLTCKKFGPPLLGFAAAVKLTPAVELVT
jgi:hypothetical protein